MFQFPIALFFVSHKFIAEKGKIIFIITSLSFSHRSADPSSSSSPEATSVLDGASSVDRLLSQSSSARSSGDHRRALFCLERALEVASASVRMRAERAEALAALGRLTEARDAANDLLRQDST